MAVSNRRSRRSKKQLQDALVRLLLTQEYDDLSVEDITEEADLGRTTFYLHYYDKGHLLAATLSELEDDLADTILELSKRSDDFSPEMFTLFFREVSSHRDLYRILLSERTGGRALHRVRRDIGRFISDVIETQQPAVQTLNEKTKTLVSAYVCGALLSTIDWWLERDLAPDPEVLGEQVYTLTLSGFDALVANKL